MQLQKENKMTRKLLVFSISLLFLALPFISSAQPEEGGEPPAEDVPFDGGVSILVAAGVSYGLAKMRKKETNVSKEK